MSETCQAYDDWGGWTCMLDAGHGGLHLERTGVYWDYPDEEDEDATSK